MPRRFDCFSQRFRVSLPEGGPRRMRPAGEGGPAAGDSLSSASPLAEGSVRSPFRSIRQTLSKRSPSRTGEPEPPSHSSQLVDSPNPFCEHRHRPAPVRSFRHSRTEATPASLARVRCGCPRTPPLPPNPSKRPGRAWAGTTGRACPACRIWPLCAALEKRRENTTTTCEPSSIRVCVSPQNLSLRHPTGPRLLISISPRRSRDCGDGGQGSP